MMALGGYVAGADPEVDLAVELSPALHRFLQPEEQQLSSFSDSRQQLLTLAHRKAGE